eukprot:TRINITY_DN17080_c0_g1_i2.p1 TRINITY_DN17080_c0_g1~~TRINITY_DN17080_c0_g1_i2.p1  ORF type:complete len:460 (+),score=78.82 TRINITY_DN17080_c0_g1_i2:48-1427(+)
MAEICPDLQNEILKSLNVARTDPSVMASIVDTEDGYIDSDLVLLLPGWERGIQLQEGIPAYKEAKQVLEHTEPMQPLRLLPELTSLAESYALRIATEQDLDKVHPPGIDLLASVRLHCKVSGLVSLNLNRGFFNTGDSVVVSWLVHDGDAHRAHRESIMQPTSQYVGIGVAKSTADNRVYIAALFCDYAAPYSDTGDVITSLFNCYNKGSSGRLLFKEYLSLINDLNIPVHHTEDDFNELYNNIKSKVKAVTGMTVEDLRAALGDHLKHHHDFIRKLVTAKNAARVVMALSNALHCPDKKSEQIPDVKGLAIDRESLLKKLISTYHDKPGDIVDEMLENYVYSEDSSDAKLLILREAADALHTGASIGYPGKNKLQLLIMRLYTMAGPDIDAIFGFQNVPDFDEDNPAPWNAYKQKYDKERNEAMFGSVNWAMRTQNWETITKHIKTISLLLALCQSTC